MLLDRALPLLRVYEAGLSVYADASMAEGFRLVGGAAGGVGGAGGGDGARYRGDGAAGGDGVRCR